MKRDGFQFSAICYNSFAMKLLLKKNYLTMIHNLAKGEIHIFRNLFMNIDGQDKDILEDGQLACGKVVSSILYLNELISDLHATVESTEKDMLINGWYEINDPREGSVIAWERQNSHRHIGFSLGNNTAVSNGSNEVGFPAKHHITYNNTRKIEKIYWHPHLD